MLGWKEVSVCFTIKEFNMAIEILAAHEIDYRYKIGNANGLNLGTSARNCCRVAENNGRYDSPYYLYVKKENAKKAAFYIQQEISK